MYVHTYIQGSYENGGEALGATEPQRNETNRLASQPTNDQLFRTTAAILLNPDSIGSNSYQEAVGFTTIRLFVSPTVRRWPASFLGSSSILLLPVDDLAEKFE